MVISMERENTICNTFDEYKKCISEKLNVSDDEMWISEEGDADDRPCLGILIKGDYAVIHFFDEDENNFVTVGNIEEKTVLFCGGEYEVVGYQIIKKETAYDVILDFYFSKDKSDKTEWEEL